MSLVYFIDEHKGIVFSALTILIFVTGFLVFLNFGDNIEQYKLNKIVKNQYDDFKLENNFDSKLKSNLYLQESKFRIWLNDNLNYKEDETNCKFYSYVWKQYLNKHDIENKYLIIKNHIFVVGQYDNKYCIYDQDIVRCVVLN